MIVKPVCTILLSQAGLKCGSPRAALRKARDRSPTSRSILIWSMALLGVSFKLFAGARFPKVSLITYLAMGWFVVAIIYPLYLAVPEGGLWLLFCGGMFFSIGVFFYRAKSKKYTHAIWHLFVVGGCLCHFYSIYYFVI